MDSIPTLSKDLIESLDRSIPHRCPLPGTPEQDIWFYSGKRALVDYLVFLLKRTEEEGLNLSSELTGALHDGQV